MPSVRTRPDPEPRPTRRRRPALPALLPDNAREIQRVADDCRQRVKRRAMISAGAAVVPLPGLDLMVDVGVLTTMLQEINEAFGLTPAQLEALASSRRLTVYRAINALGTSAVGRYVTREIVALIAKRVAQRIATKTVVRYIPLAGQAVAAGISYTALKTIGDRHIDDCVRVAMSAVDVN